MGKIEDGGPAWPCEYVKHPVREVGNEVPIMGHSSGLSKREWFAGMVLAHSITWGPAKDIAKRAYQIADAMIAASREEGR